MPHSMPVLIGEPVWARDGETEGVWIGVVLRAVTVPDGSGGGYAASVVVRVFAGSGAAVDAVAGAVL